MPWLERWLVGVTILGVIAGLGSICCVRGRNANKVLSVGYVLSAATLVFLGINAYLAALYRAEGLSLVGLAAGGIAIGMLWESPIKKSKLTS